MPFVGEYRGGGKQGTFEIWNGQFGTTEVRQIMPEYLKVRSLFLGVAFRSLDTHISIVPDSLEEIRAAIQATLQKL